MANNMGKLEYIYTYINEVHVPLEDRKQLAWNCTAMFSVGEGRGCVSLDLCMYGGFVFLLQCLASAREWLGLRG